MANPPSSEKQRQKRAVSEYLAALEAEVAAEGDAPNDSESGEPESKRQGRYERQPPKVISPSDPQTPRGRFELDQLSHQTTRSRFVVNQTR